MVDFVLESTKLRAAFALAVSQIDRDARLSELSDAEIDALIASTRAAPPAMDREAVDDVVAALLVSLTESGVRSDTLEMLTGGDDRGTIPTGVLRKAVSHALSTLSADAIRQGEGCMKAREEGYRAGYIHVLGLARAGVPTKDFERDVGAYMADFVGGRP